MKKIIVFFTIFVIMITTQLSSFGDIYQKYGDTVYGPDGVYQKYGNTVYGPNGVYQKYGNTIYGPNK